MNISSRIMGPSVRIRDGHDNFFTPLRLVFAMLVLIGHSFAIAGRSIDSEPQVFLSYTFSYLAVNLFFIASGFLVTKSMLYRGDGPAFISARVLRIFPALIVHMAFVMLVIGPIATTLPLTDYVTDANFLWQPVWVLSFFETNMTLPGVFEGNGEPFGSAPLWTLRYEVICYMATGLIFALGLMRRKWMVLAQFIVACLFWIIGQSVGVFETLPSTVENLARFGIAYGLGAVIYAYRDRISFHWVTPLLLAAICWMIQDQASVEVVMNLMLASFVMLVAYARLPKFNGLQRLDDISYGIYIYHWVVMQMIYSLFPGVGVATLIVAATPIVIVLAWASWTYVEKPMLKHKTAFGEWLRFGRNRRDYEPATVLLD